MGKCMAKCPRNNVTDSPPLQKAQGWGNLSVYGDGSVGQPAQFGVRLDSGRPVVSVTTEVGLYDGVKPDESGDLRRK